MKVIPFCLMLMCHCLEEYQYVEACVDQAGHVQTSTMLLLTCYTRTVLSVLHVHQRIDYRNAGTPWGDLKGRTQHLLLLLAVSAFDCKLLSYCILVNTGVSTGTFECSLCQQVLHTAYVWQTSVLACQVSSVAWYLHPTCASTMCACMPIIS